MARDATDFDLDFDTIYMVNKGTNDHNKLENRNIPNQHNIEAITGLMDILANTPALAGACDGGCIPVFEETEEGTVALASSGLNFQRVAAVVEGYEYVQNTPKSVWTIEHNLNKITTVSVTDMSGNLIMCDIKHIDLNKVEISFSKAFSGKAYIS